MAVKFVRDSPTALRTQIGSGPQRLLVMAENANPGWQAEVDGHALKPQVVDGRRQGFVVPAGVSGPLTVQFGPDGAYRWGLLAGALLVALLVVGVARPDRGRRRLQAVGADLRAAHPWVIAAGVVLVAGLVAGPVGLLVGLAVVAVGRWIPKAAVMGPVLVFGLGLVAATIQAWMAPGVVGTSAVEGTVRLLVLAAFALAATTGSQQSSRET